MLHTYRDGWPAIMLFEYENFASSEASTTRFLSWASSYFGLDLTSQAQIAIARHFSIENNTQRQNKVGTTFKEVNKKTQLHGYHISSNGTVGAWRQCLSEDMLAEIETLLGHEMVRFGYKLESRSASGR